MSKKNKKKNKKSFNPIFEMLVKEEEAEKQQHADAVKDTETTKTDTSGTEKEVKADPKVCETISTSKKEAAQKVDKVDSTTEDAEDKKEADVTKETAPKEESEIFKRFDEAMIRIYGDIF